MSTPEQTMVEEARKALAAHACKDWPAYFLHRANARRIADELDLQVVHTTVERAEAEAAA